MPPPIEIPDEYINNASFEVIRPFGGSTPLGEWQGSLLDAWQCGRGAGSADLIHSHILYTDPEVNIKDNITRTIGGNGLLYSDGDEVRVFMPYGYDRYVVVWTTYIKDNTSDPGGDSGYKASYLMRHEVVVL